MSYVALTFNLYLRDRWIVVCASSHHSKGMLEKQGKAEVYNCLSDLKKRHLRVTYNILPKLLFLYYITFYLLQNLSISSG